MATKCIEVSLEDSLEVLKGCSFILNELADDFGQNIYSNQGIKIIADLMTDAVTRLNDEKENENNE